MLKVLVVSNNPTYVNELKRSATLSDVEIIAVCYGKEDVHKRLNNGLNPDIIIASDILFPGSTIESVIQEVKEVGMLDKLYFVLRRTDCVELLMNLGVQYVFENAVAPQALLDMIKSPMLEQQKNNERAAEINKSQNMASLFAQEKRNKTMMENVEGYNNFSQKNVNEPTNSFNNKNYGGNNFKPIMVTICSPKGGVGKTSLSIELAFLLAARAKEVDFNPASKLNYSKKVSVCLVDLNPSFDTMAATLDCVRTKNNYPTVSDWATKIEEKVYNSLTKEQQKELMEGDGHNISEYINENLIRFTREEVESLLVHDEQTGLYLLPSIALPFDVEFLEESYIRIILKHIRAMFDVVIVDTGNNISFFTVEAMQQSNEIFIVTNSTATSSVVLGKLIKNLDRLEVDKSKFNLVVNNPNGNKSALDAETIANVLKLTLISELPFDEGVKLAHEKGVPYCIYNKKTPFAREAVKLAHQIAPLWNAVSRKKTPGRSIGLFGRK